jgi:hypothetical protein
VTAESEARLDIEDGIVEALAVVTAQEDPRVDDLLVAMLGIVDSEEVPGSPSARSATSSEVVHARALMQAFSLTLRPSGPSRRDWELSAYARNLDTRFGPPAPLDSVPEESVDIWQIYAEAGLAPFVVAHLADLVACKGRGLPSSADAAIAALLDLPGVIPDVYAADHLGRALELTAKFAREETKPVVEDALLGHADSALDDEPELGTFIGSVRSLADRSLRVDEVARLIDRAVQVWEGDSYALQAIYQVRRQIAADEESRVTAERDQVQSLLDEANGASNGVRKLALLQDAHAVAVRHSHLDLADIAQAAMRSIPADAFGFERVSVELPLPEGFADQRVAAIVGDDDLASALGRLVSDCPTGDVEGIRAGAEAGKSTGAVAAIFGTTVLNVELLPRSLHAGDDLDAAIASLQDIHMSLALPIIARALDTLRDKYDVADPWLIDELTAAGRCSEGKVSKLVRCLRRYWREDYEGAAYIGSTLCEGILRERLLAAGIDPYQLPRPDGTNAGKYKMLNQLIILAAQAGLDQSWAAWLQFALADPKFGPNLRNELLHGAVDDDPGPLNAATVLVAACYLTLRGKLTPPVGA